MSEPQKEEPIRIALTLEGEMAKRFTALKRKWGLEANTDVLRMLITMEYDKIMEEITKGNKKT